MDKEPNIGDIIFWKVYEYHPNRKHVIQWGVVYKMYTEEYGDKMLSVYLINDALINICNHFFVHRTTEVPFEYVDGSVTIYDSSIHTIDQ